MSDASLTNIRMVRPRGPKIFLGVLGVGLVAAAVWWFTRPRGAVGEPDDPRKLLVVGDAEGVAVALGELGFVAEQGTFDALAAKGIEQGARGEGLEAILYLADLRGFGYVALQDPASHGIAGVSVTAESADVTANDPWAVFSVGDLGIPPTVSTDDEASVLPLPPYVQVLRAAFNQPRLANTLFDESRLPMDAVELHARITAAIDLHGGYAMLDRKVAKDVRARAEAVVDAETIEPKPAVLAAPLEQSESLALADGTVMTFVQGWRLDSPWDPEVRVDPELEVGVWYQPAGEVDPAARKRCRSLHGGTMELGGTRHELSAAGDVLLLEAGDHLEVWALDVAAGACAWSSKGKIPMPRGDEYSWGWVGPSGRLLRPVRSDDEIVLDLWTPGQRDPDVIALPGCTEIGRPVWLDGEHFGVACHFDAPVAVPDDDYDDYDDYGDDDDYGDGDDDDPTAAAAPVVAPPPPPPKQTWIYIVRVSDRRVVAVPDRVTPDDPSTYPLYAVPGDGHVDLLAVDPWTDGVVRIRGEQDLKALFDDAEATFTALAEADLAQIAAGSEPSPAPAAPTVVDPTGGEPVDEPPPRLRPAFVPVGATVVALDAARWSSTKLGDAIDQQALALSPDGRRLVYIPRHGAHEVRVVDLQGGETTTVSSNPEVTHSEPRFTADGQAIVFNTSYDGHDRQEQVGRLAPLP